tara:strand:+ start:2492 stop:3091 length:600 start_codon:yes stop_codon:yes gene_type:complete
MPVKIHGKEYTTCAERLATFHERFKDQTKSILTEIIQFKDGIVVVKAVVKVGEEVYVGHAYEEIGSTQINTTSALENGETSAISRSLKFCLGDVDLSNEIASAEEVATAINKQESGYKMKSPDGGKRPMTGLATEKQIGYIKKLNDEKGLFSADRLEVELMNLTKERASQLIDGLMNTDNSVDEEEDMVEEVKAEDIPF